MDFWSFNQYLAIFQSKKIDNNQLYSKIDWFYIKIEIVNTISSLESESDSNRWSNVDGLSSELSTIQFVGPHRLSAYYSPHVDSIIFSLVHNSWLWAHELLNCERPAVWLCFMGSVLRIRYLNNFLEKECRALDSNRGLPAVVGT